MKTFSVAPVDGVYMFKPTQERIIAWFAMPADLQGEHIIVFTDGSILAAVWNENAEELDVDDFESLEALAGHYKTRLVGTEHIYNPWIIKAFYANHAGSQEWLDPILLPHLKNWLAAFSANVSAITRRAQVSVDNLLDSFSGGLTIEKLPGIELFLQRVVKQIGGVG